MKKELIVPVYRSYAKINLFLRVISHKKDRHQLDTIMARVDVWDDIYIVKDSSFSLQTNGCFSNFSGMNIIEQAYFLLTEHLQRALPCRIQLIKNVPFGAGLGGGSSNAAYVLKKIKMLYKLKCDITPLANILGSDVPFFLMNGTCRLQGVGDELVRVVLPGPLWAILVYPYIVLSTKDVFSVSMNNFSQPSMVDWNHLDKKAFFNALRNERNDLEKSAIAICPLLKELLYILRYLSESYQGIVGLSGSGSTCFVLFQERKCMQEMLVVLKERFPGYWIVGCKVHL